MDDSSLMAPRMHHLVQKIEARRKFAGKSKSPASARRLRLKDRATGSRVFPTNRTRRTI
jgi:hypothetical protein